MSGEWYSYAWHHIKTGGIKNLLIPIYIDKTVLLQSNKLSPVTRSLDVGNDCYGCISMVMTEPLHALEPEKLPYLLEVLLSETLIS